MPLLIDGYNLLYAIGLLSPGKRGPKDLERARRALLSTLAESLPEPDRLATTIVFDAAAAPRGVPRSLRHRGLTILFAAQHAEADELIEELIAQSASPKQLTVVSSDRRLQQAAKRRKARPVASEAWFDQLLRQRAQRARPKSARPAKPEAPQDGGEIAYWLSEFGLEEAVEPPSGEPPDPQPPPKDDAEGDSFDVFPADYFDNWDEDIR